MASKQELQVQQKRERENKEEATVPARIFVPPADIYETPDALKVVLEMPGVDKSNVNVLVEDGVLTVEGRLDFSKYQDLQPLYTEYNIGHYSRSFRLTTTINQSKIGAEMKDGVLALVLPKAEAAKSRTIQVN
jgi:HSP20 family molecular chaperone IbpA